MITNLIPWVRFAGILLVVASFFACYTLYQANQELRLSVKGLETKLNEANANIELQKKLTEDALLVKDKEVIQTKEVIKFSTKVDKVLVKENPVLAEDANKLWKEALLDE